MKMDLVVEHLAHNMLWKSMHFLGRPYSPGLRLLHFE
jgi:hypothetical protein